MAWEKVTVCTEQGELVEAQAPLIISASRSTDLPAFYADWFFHRLEKGYSVWKNPFNGVNSYISYEKTRFIVFWSKNPAPLLPHLAKLKQRNIGCYIHYTLNDYEQEGLEKAVPPLEQRIATFKELVAVLGKGHVIWRFDPLILLEHQTIDDLLSKVEYIGNELKGYTEKLVFSYVDINAYKKVSHNLKKLDRMCREFSQQEMLLFAQKLSALNMRHAWNYSLGTCGEQIDLFAHYGIVHNKCIDDELIAQLCPEDATLLKFLGISVEKQPLLNKIVLKKAVKSLKDTGQRQGCGCIQSKDIGQYNTCPHQCEYCYANTSKEAAFANFARHKAKPLSETITGE